MSSPEFFRTVAFRPDIDPTRCVKCMECVKACGLGAIIVSEDGTLTGRSGLCRNCRACIKACRYGAIATEASFEASPMRAKGVGARWTSS